MTTRAAKTVNVHEAKTHLSKLIEEAHAGGEIILAKAGKPYAKLGPLDAPPKTRRPLGLHRGTTPLSDEEAAESMQPLDEEEVRYWE